MLQAVLTRCANRDLNYARKGAVTVVETKAGAITIDYFEADRTYSMYATNGETINGAKASVARAWLMCRYDVVAS